MLALQRVFLTAVLLGRILLLRMVSILLDVSAGSQRLRLPNDSLLRVQNRDTNS